MVYKLTYLAQFYLFEAHCPCPKMFMVWFYHTNTFVNLDNERCAVKGFGPRALMCRFLSFVRSSAPRICFFIFLLILCSCRYPISLPYNRFRVCLLYSLASGSSTCVVASSVWSTFDATATLSLVIVLWRLMSVTTMVSLYILMVWHGLFLLDASFWKVLSVAASAAVFFHTRVLSTKTRPPALNTGQRGNLQLKCQTFDPWGTSGAQSVCCRVHSMF